MENNNFNDQQNTETENSSSAEQTEMNETTQLKDQLIRLGADFQNYKKRVEKDRALWTHQARADLLLQLLPVVDDFDRAMQEADKTQESGNLNQFLKGFELIHKALYEYLKKNGVTPIEDHTIFNPELHEAVMQSQVEGKQEGEIIAVLQQGFMCNGSVLRHSKVSVAC